jgi:hypothetical protein
VGADRKGPLAAFIVVAIIAAILLITSVRSQAAAGWVRNTLPSPPKVVSAVSSGFDQVVEQGTDLVPRSSGLALPPRPVVTASAVPDLGRSDGEPRHPGARMPHAPTHDAGPSPGRDGDHAGSPDAARHDHGRHLGWAHGHGHPGHGRHHGRGRNHRG